MSTQLVRPSSAGEKHWRWKGGRNKQGQYYKILCRDHPFANKSGHVYEHRLVMEKKLGRYLQPSEEVHHIDGNGFNNDPDNLMLTTHSQHTSLHKLGKPIAGGSKIKGRPFTQEHRDRIGAANKGKKRPEISARQLGAHHTPERIHNMVEGKKRAKALREQLLIEHLPD